MGQHSGHVAQAGGLIQDHAAAYAIDQAIVAQTMAKELQLQLNEI